MRRDLAILFGISLLWGSAWLLAPSLRQAAAPYAADAVSLFLSGCLLLGFSFFRLGSGAPFPLTVSAQLSLLLFAVPQTLLILAGQHGIGGWTPLLYSLMPLILAFSDGVWTSAMAVAPGAVLVLLNGTVPFTPAKVFWALPVLAAVLCQAYALQMLHRACRGRGSGRARGLQLLLAAVVLAAASAALDAPPRVPLAAGSVLAVPLHAILAVALPYCGLFFLLTRGALSPAQVAATQWLQTLAAAGMSLLLTRARPPGIVLLAACALLVCLVSVLRQPESQPGLTS